MSIRKSLIIAALAVTPSLASAQSRAEHQLPVEISQCSTNWAVSQPVISAYNEWLDSLEHRLSTDFKINIGNTDFKLDYGQVMSLVGAEVICRYNFHTGNLMGLNKDFSIHDLDLMAKSANGNIQWTIVGLPYGPLRFYTKTQQAQLVKQMFVNGVPIAQFAKAQAQRPPQPQPRNVAEGLAQAQNQANKQAEQLLRAQGIDIDAIKRAEIEETRKYAEPCRRNGGTWGRPTDKYRNATGRLGCYYPRGN
jgi:hypothetical protein